MLKQVQHDVEGITTVGAFLQPCVHALFGAMQGLRPSFSTSVPVELGSVNFSALGGVHLTHIMNLSPVSGEARSV